MRHRRREGRPAQRRRGESTELEKVLGVASGPGFPLILHILSQEAGIRLISNAKSILLKTYGHAELVSAPLMQDWRLLVLRAIPIQVRDDYCGQRLLCWGTRSMRAGLYAYASSTSMTTPYIRKPKLLTKQCQHFSQPISRNLYIPGQQLLRKGKSSSLK